MPTQVSRPMLSPIRRRPERPRRRLAAGRPTGAMRAIDAVLVATILLGLVLVGPQGGRPAQAAVPAGFVDEKVFDLRSPAAIAFLPDGRLLGASQAGVLRLW